VSIPDFNSGDESPFAEERKAHRAIQKAILTTAGAAFKTHDEIGN
jgi:hypothetical protein